MRVNALLVRWSEGWRFETDVSGLRIEGLLSIDHITSDDEVTRQAQDELARFSVGQTEITAEIDPVTRNFWVADKVTIDGSLRRCVGMVFRRDPEHLGRIEFTPTFGVRNEVPERRAARALKKMSNGGLGGNAKVASRTAGAQRTEAGPTNVCPDWVVPIDSPGAVVDADSDGWRPHKRTTMVGIILDIDEVSSADTDVTIYVNGVAQDTHTLPAYDTYYSSQLNDTISLVPEQDRVVVSVSANGGDGTGLVVHLVLNDCAQGPEAT